MMQSKEWRARLALAILLVSALLGSAVPAWVQRPAAYPRLDQRFEPLRTRFNADEGKVRLLLILDPT